MGQERGGVVTVVGWYGLMHGWVCLDGLNRAGY